MTVVFGGLTPHAPVLVPEVGRQEWGEVRRTVGAVKELARLAVMEEPDVIVIVTPHARPASGAFGVDASPVLTGDFARFRAPDVWLEAPGAPEFAEALIAHGRRMALTIEPLAPEQPKPLDYGVAVPLYYLQKAGYQGAILPVTCAASDRLCHRRFGAAIAQTASELGLRAVLLASGDLSHRLTPSAPAGYSAQGRRFDEQLLAWLDDGEWDRIYTMDEHLCEEAGECGYQALLVLLGALEHSLPKANLLAYEGPFGVGYATVTVTVEASDEQDQRFNPAGYARLVAETFLQSDRLPPAPTHFPRDPQGCFVCVRHPNGERACVGTLEPSEKTLAAEIARQTLRVLKAYADRHGLTVDTLHHLRFSVDLLGPLEALPPGALHAPQREGLVLVGGKGAKGPIVVLPALPGIETFEQQRDLALRRAGLSASVPVTFARFTSERYAEPDFEATGAPKA